MEAVGQLAGGVAHDFNNLLTAILGGCGFLLDDPALAAEHRRDVEEIQNAARRAAALTKQLLAFSRKQVLQPENLPLGAVITGVAPLLRRLIGEHVTVTTALADGLPAVRADRSQLEQVVINLCVNARDAMPKGGTLTIATEEADLDDAYVAVHPDVQAGHYVVLVVADTGIGMDEETRARAFEPFFTTKGPRFGTGLGLATVYGIVKQSNGHIAVYSEPGHGTTFRIYLPPAGGAEAVRGAARPNGTGAVRHGSETVLLVEDEQRVRTLARRILEGFGYHVLESSDGREALALGQEYTEPIALLFTDVVMPTMSGRELAERLTHAHPEVKVLFTSGYADSTIVSHGVLDPAVAYLPKPYSADALGRKVRDVLDHPAGAPAYGTRSSNPRWQARHASARGCPRHGPSTSRSCSAPQSGQTPCARTTSALARSRSTSTATAPMRHPGTRTKWATGMNTHTTAARNQAPNPLSARVTRRPAPSSSTSSTASVAAGW
jgi:CheY-like chemotaxis protein